MAHKILASRGIKIEGEAEALASAPILVVVERQGAAGGGWVARITAVDPAAKGGLQRKFLPPHSRNLSRSGNGTVHFRISESGVYEVEFTYRSLTPARAFFAVLPSGEVQEIGLYLPSEGRRPEAITERIAKELELVQQQADQAEATASAAVEPAAEPTATEPAAAEPTVTEPTPRRRSRRPRRRLSYDWWHSIVSPTPPQEGMGDWVRALEETLRAQSSAEGWIQVKALAYREGQWQTILELEAPAAEWPGIRQEIRAILESEDGAILALGEYVLAGELADRSPVVAIATPGRVAEVEGVQS